MKQICCGQSRAPIYPLQAIFIKTLYLTLSISVCFCVLYTFEHFSCHLYLRNMMSGTLMICSLQVEMPTMNHKNAFSHFHYGGDTCSEKRFTLLLLSFLLSLRVSPLCSVLTVSDFQLILLLKLFLFPVVWYFMFASKSQPCACHGLK